MIFIECKADETLVSSFNINANDIHHSNGKGGVCENLSKSTNAIGIIDKDIGSSQPGYLDLLEKIECNKDFEIYVDKNKLNKLILLCPKLEGWLIKACREANVDLNKYKLSDDEKRLHAIINLNVNKLEKVLALLPGRSSLYSKLEKYLKNPYNPLGDDDGS